ncbi:hypothetical protein CFC21_031520 [Triticum aestivum]|uniref:Uncharacterized protein n=2 Tax=Triticum aestivum TaxID=4565 RepID=A0A3B6DJB0_WHEAT|nr:hypothetical protein CFC21_031520 [Triticum aestivum]
MIIKENLYDVLKIMALLRPGEPSCVKQEAALPEKFDVNKNVPKAVQDNKAESRGEIDLSDENTPFWDKFETFQVNKQGQKDARFIVQFLRSALSRLEQTGFQEKIDAQLLEEFRHICSEFEERSASPDRPGWSPNIHHLRRTAKTACLTLEDLYSMWQDGEKKLRTIVSLLCSERASMKDDGRSSDADAHVCSDDEPGAGEPASASAKVAQKQRRKKKSKKTKGRGKK